MEFFQKHWGDIASVIGLVISFITLFVSVGARRAAREARQAVHRSNLAKELRECSDSSNHLISLCKHADWQLAAHVATQICQSLTFLVARWEHELDVVSRAKMQLAISQMQITASRLNLFVGGSPTKTDRDNLIFIVNRINLSLIEQSGHYDSLIES